MKLVICGIGVLATSAALVAQPARQQRVLPPKVELKGLPVPPVTKSPSVRKFWDPPPRVDPLPERALRLRVIDAPSVTPPH